MNVRHTLLKGRPTHHLLEQDMPNALNHLSPTITTFHLWTEPTGCLLDRLTLFIQTSQDQLKVMRGKQECLPNHLMQPIQISQDLPEVMRGMKDHLWRPSATLQSLPELSIYPQLDLIPQLQQLARSFQNLAKC